MAFLYFIIHLLHALHCHFSNRLGFILSSSSVGLECVKRGQTISFSGLEWNLFFRLARGTYSAGSVWLGATFGAWAAAAAPAAAPPSGAGGGAGSTPGSTGARGSIANGGWCLRAGCVALQNVVY